MTSNEISGSEKKTSMPPFPRRGERAHLSAWEWLFVAFAAFYYCTLFALWISACLCR